MVTIKFILNKENIMNCGQTEEDVRNFLHKFYVTDRQAAEIAPLVYQRDDENAMCSFGDIISIMRRNPEFMGLFSECTWDIDGEEEDIIAEIIDYKRRHSG